MYRYSYFKKELNLVIAKITNSYELSEADIKELVDLAKKIIEIRAVHVAEITKFDGCNKYAVYIEYINSVGQLEFVNALNDRNNKWLINERLPHSHHWNCIEIEYAHTAIEKKYPMEALKKIIHRTQNNYYSFVQKAKKAKIGSAYADFNESEEYKLLLPFVPVFSNDVDETLSNTLKLQKLISDAKNKKRVFLYDISSLVYPIYQLINKAKLSGDDPYDILNKIYEFIFSTGYIEGIYFFEEVFPESSELILIKKFFQRYK